MRSLFKVGILSFHNILKLLCVPVDKREPGALYLHHDFVAFFEGVQHIGQQSRLLAELVTQAALN